MEPRYDTLVYDGQCPLCSREVRAWSHTPFGFMFKPLLWPGLYQIASPLYEFWADRRFERKYACAECDAG